MMYWRNGDWNWAAWVAMTASMVLFWGSSPGSLSSSCAGRAATTTVPKMSWPTASPVARSTMTSTSVDEHQRDRAPPSPRTTAFPDDRARRPRNVLRDCGQRHRSAPRPPAGGRVISDAHALLEIGRVDAISQAELGARLRLEKSTVSRPVRFLEERGWVARQRSAVDGRVDELSLTKEGSKVTRDLARARPRTTPRHPSGRS